MTASTPLTLANPTSANGAHPSTTSERTLETPEPPCTRRIPGGTVMRLVFGAIYAIDAVLKWLPGFRHTFVSQLRTVAQGQPGFLHGWFHFWIQLEAGAPTLWWVLIALTETVIALVLLLGVARRVGYPFAALYMLIVWGVGEGFGGPYMSGATDIGTGIIYSVVFLTLLAYAPPARKEPLSLDAVLVRRVAFWRHLAEPHKADRAPGR